MRQPPRRHASARSRKQSLPRIVSPQLVLYVQAAALADVGETRGDGLHAAAAARPLDHHLRRLAHHGGLDAAAHLSGTLAGGVASQPGPRLASDSALARVEEPVTPGDEHAVDVLGPGSWRSPPWGQATPARRRCGALSGLQIREHTGGRFQVPAHGACNRVQHLAVGPRGLHVSLTQQRGQAMDVAAEGAEFGAGGHQRGDVVGATVAG
jgi:hypothetical protein